MKATSRATACGRRTVTEEQFDGLMNVRLQEPFFLTQPLLPLLKEGRVL